jgi:predicted lipoprotein with Yx(FWY)xxD motif
MRPTPKTLLPALAISLTLAACGSSSSGSTSSSSSSPASTAASSASAADASSSSGGSEGVKTASNATLGSTVLVDAQGRTLYHLSGEGNGRFLCTSAACVAAWPPVSASAIGTGVSGLAAVKRPDGSEQLAYNGEPLYTFTGDKAAGEANGQGIKADGGTWSAVVTGAGGTGAAQTSSSGETSGSGAAGGGGGGYNY